MPENKEDLLRGVVHRVNVEDRSGSWMGARECLCVATDEEQYQITAGEFITANKPVGFIALRGSHKEEEEEDEEEEAAEEEEEGGEEEEEQ